MVTPYLNDKIKRRLAVGDYDFAHNTKFLDSRNRAIILVFLDTGLRSLSYWQRNWETYPSKQTKLR